MAEAIDQSDSTQLIDHNETRWLLSAESDIDPAISIVMPTLNEEEGISECIARVQNALDELQIHGEVIISDSSTDRTPEIAKEMGAIVVEPDGKGYGYAYRYAFERVRGEYVVMGDADTTYDFERIPALLEPVRDGSADICMGSRLEGDIRDGSMPPLHKHIGNPLLTKFLNTFYDAGVSDAHSGFRVFSRTALDELNLDTDGMEFASEMIMDAGAKDLEIEEIPIVYHEREGEETLDSFSDGWRHVRFMLVNAPGYLFSIPGLTLGIGGLLIMATALTTLSVGSISLGPHSMVAGSLSVLVGFQALNMGVFATVTGDPIQQPTDRVTRWLTDNLRLERGVMAGLAMFTAGVTYAGYLVFQWVASGFTALPLLLGDIVAFTAIVLGLQTIFSAFFMSTIVSQQT